ncbi:MAG: RdgB/HAM1 family non-canonical purine NTP pyrophosphatase [Flavobacteriaceae bacterium]|jgi:XTP/dITP diphosphohydrolase|nr:RdgB/HAM1 family non-canonical purine NTP pyrophosphatase [Flavobacteriaceae bacterium]
MNTLVFATHNVHKVEEVLAMLKDRVNVVDLEELMFFDTIPETGNNLSDNALQKAHFIREKIGLDCFADDTGLEVDALNGEPGVISARYAGEPSDSERNIDKLLQKLSNNTNRNAQFRCVIALILNNETHLFEGIVRGRIATERFGHKGFGYDSIFIPDGYEKTFAQLLPEEKNKISHRSLAVKQLSDFFS